MRTQNFIPHFSTVSVRMNFQGNKCLKLSFKETQNLAFSTFLCNIFISQTNILIKPKYFLKYFFNRLRRNCGDFVTFTSQKLREINASTTILRCAVRLFHEINHTWLSSINVGIKTCIIYFHEILWCMNWPTYDFCTL